jgi:tetratricopeptide (TPR) repeat protein
MPSHDWTAWFSRRLAQLINVIDQWHSSPDWNHSHLQLILHQEIVMFDVTRPLAVDDQYKLSRRQVLVTLAALPIALAPSVQAGETAKLLLRKFLNSCTASITACWHLLKGSDLATVEDTIGSYLLPLAAIAQQASEHQATAAILASQAYRMLGIVALHHSQFRAREHYFNRALFYARVAEDPHMEASALISLGSTPLLYTNDPAGAAIAYERALEHEKAISPLQRVRIYAELSGAYAKQGLEQEALRFLGMSQEEYPSNPENDPTSLYAEFTPSSFILDQGFAYLALSRYRPDGGYQRQAWDAFGLLAKHENGSDAVPQRIRIEIINQQAMTAVELGELDLLVPYLIEGVQGAEMLGSAQRRREAWEAWQRALHVWPRERRVAELVELFPPALVEHTT